MLERIHIENFKCLRDVTVELGDFTILIGPNDSGKSSFLEAIQIPGKIALNGYSAAFAGARSVANLVWRKDPNRHIVIQVEANSAQPTVKYHLQMPVDQRPAIESLEWNNTKMFWTDETAAGRSRLPLQTPPGSTVIMDASGTPQQHRHVVVPPGNLYLTQFLRQRPTPRPGIADALSSSIEYHFDLDKLSQPSVPQPGIVLDAAGSNLAAVLDLMQNSPDRTAFEALQRDLKAAIPTLAGIVLPPSPQPPGSKALEYILSGSERPPVTIPGSLASGGALLLTGFLTLAYADTPHLLLFEEPENGLHPFRLHMVIDILRKMTRGEVGNRKRQIVVTTHNPLLLNYAKPEEVRVFIRHPEDGTQVIPMTKIPDIDRLLKEFALGELWYLLGEEKLFVEQPA